MDYAGDDCVVAANIRPRHRLNLGAKFSALVGESAAGISPSY